MSALLGLLGAGLMLPGASIALPRGVLAAYDFSRSNYANWSEDLTQTSWGRANASVSTVQTALADGALGNVTKLADNTNNSQHLIYPANVPVADNAPESFVWRVKAAEYRYVGVQWANKAYTGYPTIIVDLQDGVVLNAQGASAGTTLSLSSAGTTTVVTITPVGNGWYDVAVSVPSVGVGSNSPRPALLLQTQATNSNNFTFAGTGTSGVLIHRMQWNLTLNPLPYERTTDGQTVVDRSVRLGAAPVRTNHLTYSDDLTQSVWSKSRVTATATRVTTDATANGFDYVWQALGGAVQGQAVSAFVDLVQGNTTVTDVRVLTNNGSTAIRSARVRWSDRTLVPHPDNATAGTVAIEERGGGVLRVTITVTLPALVASTGLFVYPSGWSNNNGAGQYVDVLRSQWGAPGAPYQRQTHGLLIDDSLRGVNMALTPDGFGSGFTNPGLPTGWRYASDAPVSASVTAIRPNTSIPGTYEVDITATNSDTVTRAFRLYISPAASASDAVMVMAGDVVTLSAGLASNVTGNVSLNVYNYNAGRNFLANSSFSVNLAAGAPLARVGAARALTSDSTVVYALGVIEFALGAGASRSLTVHAPSFARGDIGLGYLRPPTHATLGSNAAAADSNDPTWGPTGMQFLGDDYANVSLPNADQMSWYVVAQQDVAPSNSGGNQAAFISKDVGGAATNPTFAVQFGSDLVPYNLACIVPSNPPTGDGNISSAGSGTFKLTLGVPAGIGGTYDGATLKTFVGGRLRGTATRTGVLANTAGPLRIGQQKLGTNRYMTGTVYLVLVWSRALTDREMGQVDRAVREYLGRKGVQYDRI